MLGALNLGGLYEAFSPALAHWCFGITILVGLVASGFTGAETVLAVLVAGCTSTLSAICNFNHTYSEAPWQNKRLGNQLNFLIVWLDILANLVAAATCARLASATIDYISKGHFREFLFGLEQHSLGEPWPDVLGVTIILVVTVLFMMGLEKSSSIALLLFMVLLSKFAFFTLVGSFHTVHNFQNWVGSLKVHSLKAVLNAAALCSYSFCHAAPSGALKMATVTFMPWLFYTVLTIVFSLMTQYRELQGTAIPLIQVFQTRDVDWARPVMAVFTICAVCLLLTEVLPNVYMAFVRLSDKEWKVFVSSIGYQTRSTGAPILAIFAAGSVAAILAFACPLSDLIKLLNATTLVKCVLVSCDAMATRYRPDVIVDSNGDLQVISTSSATIQYSKLNQTQNNRGRSALRGFRERLRACFTKTPQYIHKLSSPKLSRTEEQECLLFENRSANIIEESSSDNEENEMEVMSCDGNHTDTSTDIDVVVEEYKEGLKVTTMGTSKTPSEPRRATNLTFSVSLGCLAAIILTAISVKLHSLYSLLMVGGAIILTLLPQNASEKSQPCALPSWLFPVMHCASIVASAILTVTVITAVWAGVVFWTIAGFVVVNKNGHYVISVLFTVHNALWPFFSLNDPFRCLDVTGLLLYWRCDCCHCDVMEPLVDRATSKVDPQHVIYEFKGTLPGENSVIVAR